VTKVWNVSKAIIVIDSIIFEDRCRL